MPLNKLKTLAKGPTDAVFGQDLEGNTFGVPLREGPHWIVSGQTGSGKSVFMNALLISMIYHADPDELKIVWIDPKKVEATAYVGLPYCPIDPVTDMNDAYGLTAYLCWMMDDRYAKMSKIHVKNLPEFNDWIRDHPDKAAKRGYEPMPYWICVIDEFSDMIMQEKTVESNIIRLSQKARAAGIVCLIATQRPSADVISGTLKSNVPCRIALKVADTVNSMIILDEPGAEKLAGYGDAIIKLNDGSMTRVQGPYVETAEIEKIFGYLRDKYGKPKHIDYKQLVVDKGFCEWVPLASSENNDDSMPMHGVSSGNAVSTDPASVYPKGTAYDDMHVARKSKMRRW